MKELEKYTKQEIIEAIEKMSKYHGNYHKTQLIDFIENSRRQKIFEDEQTARHKEIDCMNDYFNWQKEMVNKYGKDGKCPIANIPKDDLEKGVKLSNLWKEAEEKVKTLEKKTDHFFK